jgi:uncharacterized protein (TIGR03503 family)
MVMIHRCTRVVTALLCVVAFVASGALLAAEPPKADVRVLIDISGSMRQNDPNNLRRPALRMLSGLLQPGTRAGVWTFASEVNNLVPVAEVDAGWKKRTESLSQQIGSPGQFTDIEAVLDAASSDWSDAPPTHTRHLVLLTDGMVDVAKAPDESASSRARIIRELLPRLQADDVKVHTIALSERADHALMRRLAGETGGWYQQVEQAADLQRVFLRMFEKVGEPDTVPLDGNQFVIDGAVNEFTVLAFSRPDSDPVQLTSPSGEVFTDSDLPSGVAWYRDQGYDMITIASPMKGEWVLTADVDPDNRVMIVTDLRLQTSDIPTHLAVGEPTRVEAALNNRGKVVTRKAFLRLLDVHARTSGVEGMDRLDFSDSGEPPDAAASDGLYNLGFAVDQPAEDVELTVTVESPTFMRQKRYRMVIHEVADGTIEDTPDGPVLQVDLQAAVMSPDATLKAWQVDADGNELPLEPSSEVPGTWRMPLQDPMAASYVQVVGTTRSGWAVDRRIGPFVPEGVEPPPPLAEAEPQPEPAPVEVAEVIDPEPEAVVEPEPEVDAEPTPEPEASPWLMPAIAFGAFNGLLLLVGLVWFLLRRRARKAGDDAIGDLFEDGEGSEGHTQGAPKAAEADAETKS